MPNPKKPVEAGGSCGTQLRFYRQYLERLPECWFIRFGRRHQVMVNAVLAKMLGLRRRVLGWEEWLVLVHPDDVRQLEDAISQALKTNSEYLAFARILLRDGTYRRMVAAGMSVPCPLRCPHGCRLIVSQFRYA